MATFADRFGTMDVTTLLGIALFALVVVPIALITVVTVGSGPSLGLLNVVAVWLLLVGVSASALYRRMGAGTDEREHSKEGRVWDVIPSWQYDGRHVESGGLSRGEQEQALEEIQKSAADIERHRRFD